MVRAPHHRDQLRQFRIEKGHEQQRPDVADHTRDVLLRNCRPDEDAQQRGVTQRETGVSAEDEYGTGERDIRTCAQQREAARIRQSDLSPDAKQRRLTLHWLACPLEIIPVDSSRDAAPVHRSALADL